MQGKFISYLRVSTDQQARSGLGIEAQRAAVAAYLNGGAWTLLGEFVETESGKRTDRPQLAAALDQCRLTGATLVVAKLDRLARNAAFLLNLRDAGVEFLATDMPHANRLTVGIMALVAEQERDAISARTKAALAEAKKRGIKLGGYRGGPLATPQQGAEGNRRKADAFAARVLPTIKVLQAEGMGAGRIAMELGRQGILTASGGQWHPNQVRRVIARGATA